MLNLRSILSKKSKSIYGEDVLELVEEAKKYCSTHIGVEENKKEVSEFCVDDYEKEVKKYQNIPYNEIRYSRKDYDVDKCLELNKLINKNSFSNTVVDPIAVDKELVALLGESFLTKMLVFMQRKNLRAPQVYKAAEIDRKLFSKICSDKNYKPSKDTCIALLFALKLSKEEADDMLETVGYTLSRSNKRDIVFEFLFIKGIYDIKRINEILYILGMDTLGR